MNTSHEHQHDHDHDHEQPYELNELWRQYLTTGDVPKDAGRPWFMSRALRPLVRRLPANPRCRLCDYPFKGAGGLVARSLLGIERSTLNPLICNICEIAIREYKGGAELELSLLFADVRGSTSIAEKLSPAEFSRVIDRFYTAASQVLFEKYGLLEKLIGDEVAGFFVPGIAGREHAQVAIKAGEAILRATGHGDREGPWIPVGVGVHTGVAYVGAVGSGGGVPDITVLGDAVNTAARIASQAGAGELLFSEASRAAAGLDSTGLEARHLALKGKSEVTDVWVKKVQAHV
jgi:adenylate cyclase